MLDNNKQTALVVDDIAENIALLSGILKEKYNVLFAKSGKMTFKVLDKNLPDIILLDIMMPEMDGYEVCRRLKENPKLNKIPVIFVSAKNQEVDEIMGLELGAVDYLTKPLSPALVKRRVSTHLALYDQNRELENMVVKRTAEIEDTRRDIIHKLSIASEYKDSDTGNHILRVSSYCYIIAKQYGFSESDANILREASPMHDIGKMGIPDNILLKPGKLEEDEWKVITTHCQIGYKIIGDYESGLLYVAAQVAKEHHEKWNGLGYPSGLKGDDIDINARIVAVADVYDALTSVRPYKKAWTSEAAVELIKQEAKEHFDPLVVDAFVKCLPDIVEIKRKIDSGEITEADM